jgi:SAM-dependent methyltransferase
MIIVWVVAVIVFLSWLMIVFVGAPYVPTRSRDLQAILTGAGLKKGELIVDLGSGDGRLLLAAAQAGFHAKGYELNPFLVLLTWWRLRQHRATASVTMADFWLKPLPNETKAVFVFLAQPFMARLEKKLDREAKRLGHDIVLVSYGFEVKGRKTAKTDGSLLIYTFKA